MGGGAADERQEMASLPIPDELFGEILLRLPTPADLVRASAACVAFRRVAAERSILRRLRKLHAPPLLGFLAQPKVFHPAIAPNRSASAASAVAKAGDFSFSFLPAPVSDWVLRDVRDGRVLLERRMPVHGTSSTVLFPDVVVCDPLHRRYLRLPPIPEDLAASVEDPILTRTMQLRVHNFLLPTWDGEDEEADETSFGVIWMTQCKTRLVAFVFSSNTGHWEAVPSRRWSDLSADLPPLTSWMLFYSRHYVYGCLYFAMQSDAEETIFLVLDIKTMDFSITSSPPETTRCCGFAMVEAGEGRPGMLVQEDHTSDLSYFIRQNDGGSSSLWQMVKTISLDSWAFFVHNTEKTPLLCLGQGQSSLLETTCFTLNIETLQLEKVCTLGPTSYDSLHAYSNFPPSLLSSPTISSGVEKGPEKEMPEQGCAASSSTQSPLPECAAVNAGAEAVLRITEAFDVVMQLDN